MMNPTDPINTPAPSAPSTPAPAPAPGVAQPVVPSPVAEMTSAPVVETPTEIVTPETNAVSSDSVEGVSPVSEVTPTTEPVVSESTVEVESVSAPESSLSQGEQPPVPQPIEAATAAATATPSTIEGAVMETPAAPQPAAETTQPIVMPAPSQKPNKLVLIVVAAVGGIVLVGAGIFAALTLF